METPSSLTDAAYTCSICGKFHHIPDLARDCENRHTEKTNDK